MLLKNVVLVGFMGTGKTEIGKLLARKLRCSFIDTDCLIEEREGKEISCLFKEKGEPYFRAKEAEVIAEVSRIAEGTAVIATGGGVVLREDNMKNLRQRGVIIALTASAAEIFRRVKGETHRPLLQVDDPRMEIEKMLTMREPFYREADLIVNTEGATPLELVDRILNMIANQN